MKLLETNKRILIMLGSCLMEESMTPGEKITCLISASLIYLYQSFSAISSAIFILKHVSDSIEDTLYALLQIAGLTYLLYALIVAFIWRHKINRIFVTLSEIYDECECDKVFEKKCSQLVNFTFIVK